MTTKPRTETLAEYTRRMQVFNRPPFTSAATRRAVKISTKRQETQAKVLAAMQARGTQLWWAAERIGDDAGLSKQSAAAALKLLADKGLVLAHVGVTGGTRYDLTDAGREAGIK